MRSSPCSSPMLTRPVSLLLLAAVCLATLASVGCNTINGLGKDIEKGGQKMQDASGTQPQEW